MIPLEKVDAVARALRSAFGVAEYEDVDPLTAGLSSALVFRIAVKGRPYLLRVIARQDAMGDPTRQFTCMQSAADAGLAPKVLYTSIEDRISLTDFVGAKPFPRQEALVRLPATLKSLHALPLFPAGPDYLDFVDRSVERFRAAKILPESETAEVFDLYAKVAAIYPRHDQDTASCHNDLKPENILFDGDRVWLVDWEAGFQNDRYADLSIAANFLVTDDAEEETYLHSYFGEAGGSFRMARFYLMRQVMHMSYAAVFLLIGSAGKRVEVEQPVPDFREFHDAIWAGELSLAANEPKVQYGRVHLKQALQNMRSARFEEALRIVGEGRSQEDLRH